ncbi:MAG: ATPase [Candidatus Helarchaeota archaeon]
MGYNRICNKCILTDRTPNIKFDKNGVCNYCNSYIPMKTKSEEELKSILNLYKKKNKQYDCIVGVSGGRDSIYTLWKLVNDYKMKVLAVTYNNPFTSEQAKRNIKNAVKILGVDLVKWEYQNNAHLNATKKYLKIWNHKPSSALIPIICAHCKCWWPEFFKISRDNNVSLIVIGTNPLETASFKKGSGFEGARTYHKFSNIPKTLLKSLRELVKNPRYLKTDWGMVFKMYLSSSHSTPYMKWRYKDIKVIRLFDYIKWNEKMVEKTISNHLKWKKSYRLESSWRFDCRLDYVRRLMYSSMVGCTELRDLLSKMIREKMITRDEAMGRIEKEETVPDELVNGVLNDIGFRLEDLNIDIDENLSVGRNS